MSILSSLGWATRDQIVCAFEQKQEKLIGETLVEMGVINDDQLEQALLKQRAARGKISKREHVQQELAHAGRMQEKITSAFQEISDAAECLSSAATAKAK